MFTSCDSGRGLHCQSRLPASQTLVSRFREREPPTPNGVYTSMCPRASTEQRSPDSKRGRGARRETPGHGASAGRRRCLLGSWGFGPTRALGLYRCPSLLSAPISPEPEGCDRLRRRSDSPAHRSAYTRWFRQVNRIRSVQRGSLAEPQTLDLKAAGISTTSSLQ